MLYANSNGIYLFCNLSKRIYLKNYKKKQLILNIQNEFIFSFQNHYHITGSSDHWLIYFLIQAFTTETNIKKS